MPELATPITWPLMNQHVNDDDFTVVIDFLKQKPRLTQSEKVREFEEAWSDWIGMPHSLYVNSGSSANLITLAMLKETQGTGEVILSPLNWVSDILSVVWMGFKPVFVDIDLETLGMNGDAVLRAVTPRTRAVLLTHIMGFSALKPGLVDALKKKNITLIEDVCESYGASFDGRKLGAWGGVSNFSFYFGHHLTTVEGGMVSCRDEKQYQVLRMLRAHGMVRESNSEALREEFRLKHQDLHPEFIFAYAGFNMRGTEIQAVIGRNQLKRLDAAVAERNRQYQLFLDTLDPRKFRTDFRTAGMSNYGFVLLIRDADLSLQERVVQTLQDECVEFRRGASGGGNQLRQPYLQKLIPDARPQDFPNTEHVHRYAFYFGNYPGIAPDRIRHLAERLNRA